MFAAVIPITSEAYFTEATFTVRQNVRLGTGGHTDAYPRENMDYLPGVNRPKLEADHSPAINIVATSQFSHTFYGLIISLFRNKKFVIIYLSSNLFM
jgi:hypothetical protein